MPGISPHALTGRLRQFETHGIVIRTAYAEIPHASSTSSPPSVRGCATSSTPWVPGLRRSPSPSPTPSPDTAAGATYSRRAGQSLPQGVVVVVMDDLVEAQPQPVLGQ
ncbi:hypothetical protein RB628_31245 [Streptomyces sp. ADMS]|nr:hypothetical protein [Streptomyces sp. ADMS]MDW4909697.1 hypothetical protein [Streptomyces sp. ADMS]